MTIYQDLTSNYLDQTVDLLYSVFKPNTTPDKEKILKDFYTTTSNCFIAIIDEIVVGLVVVTTDRSLFSTQVHGHISWLCVDAEYRGHGIAKVLMQMAESWAKNQGAKFVDLSSAIKPEREFAHKLYESCGYRSDSQKYFIKHI